MMSAALPVARVLENLAELRLGIAIPPASNVAAVNQHHHDLVDAAGGLAVITKGAAQFIGQTLGHGRLADADAAMKEKALQSAALQMLFPLVADDGGEL